MSELTVKIYDRKASSYEKKWKNYLKHTHDEFLRRIDTTSNDTVLDVSCGTGLLAKKMIEENFPFDKLILNDPSKQMLASARNQLSDEPNINFTNDRVEQLSNVQKNYFNRIFCLNSFHFYTGQQQVLEQLYTILKPGGRLYILDWNRAGFFNIVNKVIQWSTSAHIDTKSLPELTKMLQKSSFKIYGSEQWSWRYWKFLFIEAGR